MLRVLSVLLVATTLNFLTSCLWEGDNEECGFYLKFIYDYNMEYADAFDPLVPTVDVFVFDESGRYLFSDHASREQLENGNRMKLGEGLKYGTYKILTVGGLSDSFSLTDGNGESLRQGISRIEDVRLSLIHNSDVSFEFPPVWFGRTVTIDYRDNEDTENVYLVKQTNMFNLMLVRQDDADDDTRDKSVYQYTFEITTPENAAYDYEDRPLLRQELRYKPFSLTHENDTDIFSVGHINTCRLFYNDEYRLVVSNKNTLKTLWECDLMPLLEKTKPNRKPDNTTLAMQEYLDRQSSWNVVVLHKGGSEDDYDAFMAMKVIVNDWIVWERDVDL